VTRASLREYAAVQRERHQHATRAEKHRLLDETRRRYRHRKAAIWLLRRAPRLPTASSRAGRPRCYGPHVAAAAEVLWQATGRMGAHRLRPFVPVLIDRLVQCGELSPDPALDKLLRPASRPTARAPVGASPRRYPLRGATTTRPCTWLKQPWVIVSRTRRSWRTSSPSVV
jgi:hypothetical protein